MATNTKTIATRIQQRHDSETNWNAVAKTFKPNAGELIVYDPDTTYNYARFKMGDGSTTLEKLPFVAEKNQNAFSNIAIGSTVISADSPTDTLALTGKNITIIPAATEAKITFEVPGASKDQAGVTIVYPASSCTTFSSDSGTVTPLAVQKGAKMFAITRPSSTTATAITRYSNTSGDVQDSTIKIEDVTNEKDSAAAQVIAIPASGGKKMVYGYCTDQTDGTSFLGGLFNSADTSYPYAAGLAIGGTSGNLLWKGDKVATASEIPTTLKNPKALTIGNKSYDGSAEVSVTAADLGLDNALHFIGTTTSELEDGSDDPYFSHPVKGEYKAAAGDVVLSNDNEYVFDGTYWLELGDGSSHALKSVTIKGGDGLTGSGTLASDVTISHADTSSQASVTANGRKYITGVTLDTYGHVTGLTTGTETVTDSNDNQTIKGNGSAFGANDAVDIVGDGATTVTANTANKTITISSINTNTTYDLSAAASENNNEVTLNLTAGGSGSGTDSVTIKGGGATTVTTDASGVITVSSTNSNTTYSAGTGLALSGTTFSVKTDYTTSGKNYKVQTDSSGNLYVNVPWTDTNTTYSFGSGDSQGQYKVSSSNYSVNGLSSTSSPTFAAITASGQITASSFQAKSDKRLKENLTEYTSDRSILDLPVYKFDFIEGAKNQVGCMAQDLQKICPEIVAEDGSGYLSIQESKIVYLLLEEVKKLNKKIFNLENKLTNLQSKHTESERNV